jgi:hypothetical protein
VQCQVLPRLDALPVLESDAHGQGGLALGQAAGAPELGDASGDVTHELVRRLAGHARSVPLLANEQEPSYMMGVVKARRRKEEAALAEPAFDDLSAMLAADIGRTAARLTERARALKAAGSDAYDAAGEVSRYEVPGELLRRSYRLQGVVLQAVSALLEVQFQAGRLSALATVRDSAEVNDADLD